MGSGNGVCGSLGKRLPTEAEWEFAAGGGTAMEFPWGDEMPDKAKANWSGTGPRAAEANVRTCADRGMAVAVPQ